MYRPISFTDFDGRTEALRAVIRYHRFTPMYYRTNLDIHSRRLCFLVEELIPFAQKIYPSFDADIARTMAHVHDDMEIIMGDIQLGHKLVMNKKELASLHAQERDAIAKISKRFPKTVNGYSYRGLMERYQTTDPNDIEMLVIKYCDKLDAYCEALHEVFAGNIVFTKPFESHLTPPIESYTNILRNFSTVYPIFAPLHSIDHPLLEKPKDINAEAIAAIGRPHSETSIHAPTGYSHYDAWRRITIDHMNDGIKILTEKKEPLKK